MKRITRLVPCKVAQPPSGHAPLAHARSQSTQPTGRADEHSHARGTPERAKSTTSLDALVALWPYRAVALHLCCLREADLPASLLLLRAWRFIIPAPGEAV